MSDEGKSTPTPAAPQSNIGMQRGVISLGSGFRAVARFVAHFQECVKLQIQNPEI